MSSDIDDDVAIEVRPAEERGHAIRIRGLSKCYEIYERPHLRLMQTLMRGRRRFYREFWALSDVSLDVRRGETVGIIGRNGSGKSTLLQLVAGTLTPTSGEVSTHGRVAALLELGSGFNPEFTGRENVFLNGSILGIPRAAMSEALPAIEAFADIGDFIDQPVKTYSSGMMMRLAFSVAVHSTPDILIVDEALGVGDTAFQSKCLARIREMQRNGVAMLLVSHASNTIIEFCDRAAYLDRGRVMAMGGCREVVERYTNDVIVGVGGVPLSAPREHADPASAAPSATVVVPLPARSGAAPPSEILSVRVTDDTGQPKAAFAHGEWLRVLVEVDYHEDNAAPGFGIQLKTPDDIVLWTCTTFMMDRPVEAARAGDRITYEWRLCANIGGGRYVLGIGCGTTVSGAYRPHSRLHYAGHFDVLPQPRVGSGFLEPHAAFTQRTG